MHYLHVFISFLNPQNTTVLEVHAIFRLFCGPSWATEWQFKIAFDLVNCSNISERPFYVKISLSGSWLENLLHGSQNLWMYIIFQAGEPAARWRMKIFVSWGNLSYSHHWFWVLSTLIWVTVQSWISGNPFVCTSVCK